MSILNLELDLKKYQNKYYYELCCPYIVNLYNECPNSNGIGLKINKFFKINGSLYEAIELVEFIYTNLTTSEYVSIPYNIENRSTIDLNLDKVEKNNKICIKKFKLEVKPSCLKNVNGNEKCTLDTIAKLISTDGFLKEDILDKLLDELFSKINTENTDDNKVLIKLFVEKIKDNNTSWASVPAFILDEINALTNEINTIQNKQKIDELERIKTSYQTIFNVNYYVWKQIDYSEFSDIATELNDKINKLNML